MSQFDETVIPGEQNDVERDPESRKMAENEIILDYGSHPAPRDLAGMTNYHAASRWGGGCLSKFQMPRISTRRVLLLRKI